jgi:hypothetical protein
MAYPSFTEDGVERCLLTWVRNSASLSSAFLVRLLVGARDRSAEIDVATGHRVLAGEQPDLQRAAALTDAPPPGGLVCLGHEASIDNSSRTNPWTMPNNTILKKSVYAGSEVGRVGVEPTT